jgi:hypothetical protein
MKQTTFFYKTAITLLLSVILISSCNKTPIKINDEGSILSEMNAPVRIDVKLSKKQLTAAKEGRLALLIPSTGEIIPVQLESTDSNRNSAIIFKIPSGNSYNQGYKLIENKTTLNENLKALTDSKTGQVIVQEGEKKVLQYNYQTVYEKDVIRPESEKNVELVFSNMSGVYYDEYLKANPEVTRNDSTKSSIYSVPRSDYIHPLYGLNGEMLTNDWPDGGHPHHRGIFWAWPEVDYGNQRGDIYALQRIFARPTGNIEYISGPVFAQIDAENLWMWEDAIPIVNEQAVIRVYHSAEDSRIIDLTIKLLALKDSVTIATRFTNSYGGLNIRMQTPENQEISYFTDEKGSNPLRAWSDFSGIFEGNNLQSGLMVLQHKDNPEYPGEWREYPDLAWVQPTFPTPETRYLLSKKEPLVLRFRMIIHSGGKQNEAYYIKNWDAYHSVLTALQWIKRKV